MWCPNVQTIFKILPLAAEAMVSVSGISFFAKGAKNLRGNSLNENLLLSSNLLSAPTFIFKVDSMLIRLQLQTYLELLKPSFFS